MDQSIYAEQCCGGAHPPGAASFAVSSSGKQVYVQYIAYSTIPAVPPPAQVRRRPRHAFVSHPQHAGGAAGREAVVVTPQRTPPPPHRRNTLRGFPPLSLGSVNHSVCTPRARSVAARAQVAVRAQVVPRRWRGRAFGQPKRTGQARVGRWGGGVGEGEGGGGAEVPPPCPARVDSTSALVMLLLVPPSVPPDEVRRGAAGCRWCL